MTISKLFSRSKLLNRGSEVRVHAAHQTQESTVTRTKFKIGKATLIGKVKMRIAATYWFQGRINGRLQLIEKQLGGYTMMVRRQCQPSNICHKYAP